MDLKNFLDIIDKLDKAFTISDSEFKRCLGARLSPSELNFVLDFDGDIVINLEAVRNLKDCKARVLVLMAPYAVDYWTVPLLGFRVETRHARWARESISRFLNLDNDRAFSKAEMRVIYDKICVEFDASLQLATAFIDGGYKIEKLKSQAPKYKRSEDLTKGAWANGYSYKPLLD